MASMVHLERSALCRGQALYEVAGKNKQKDNFVGCKDVNSVADQRGDVPTAGVKCCFIHNQVIIPPCIEAP